MEKIKLKLQMWDYFAVDSNGAQGGLALMWNNYANVKILHFNARFITTKVFLPSLHMKFIFTGLYGEPRVEKRTQFWNYFASVHLISHDPWVVMGDYNQSNSSS